MNFQLSTVRCHKVHKNIPPTHVEHGWFTQENQVLVYSHDLWEEGKWSLLLSNTPCRSSDVWISTNMADVMDPFGLNRVRHGSSLHWNIDIVCCYHCFTINHHHCSLLSIRLWTHQFQSPKACFLFSPENITMHITASPLNVVSSSTVKCLSFIFTFFCGTILFAHMYNLPRLLPSPFGMKFPRDRSRSQKWRLRSDLHDFGLPL